MRSPRNPVRFTPITVTFSSSSTKTPVAVPSRVTPPVHVAPNAPEYVVALSWLTDQVKSLHASDPAPEPLEREESWPVSRLAKLDSDVGLVVSVVSSHPASSIVIAAITLVIRRGLRIVGFPWVDLCPVHHLKHLQQPGATSGPADQTPWGWRIPRK